MVWFWILLTVVVVAGAVAWWWRSRLPAAVERPLPSADAASTAVPPEERLGSPGTGAMAVGAVAAGAALHPVGDENGQRTGSSEDERPASEGDNEAGSDVGRDVGSDQPLDLGGDFGGDGGFDAGGGIDASTA